MEQIAQTCSALVLFACHPSLLYEAPVLTISQNPTPGQSLALLLSSVFYAALS